MDERLDFTDEKYWEYVALALPLIRDGEVFPLSRFERLVGLSGFSATRFLNRLLRDGLIIGGTGAPPTSTIRLTPLGHRAVQHIVTVKDGIALLRVKIKIPEALR